VTTEVQAPPIGSATRRADQSAGGAAQGGTCRVPAAGSGLATPAPRRPGSTPVDLRKTVRKTVWKAIKKAIKKAVRKGESPPR